MSFFVGAQGGTGIFAEHGLESLSECVACDGAVDEGVFDIFGKSLVLFEPFPFTVCEVCHGVSDEGGG